MLGTSRLVAFFEGRSGVKEGVRCCVHMYLHVNLAVSVHISERKRHRYLIALPVAPLLMGIPALLSSRAAIASDGL